MAFFRHLGAKSAGQVGPHHGVAFAGLPIALSRTAQRHHVKDKSRVGSSARLAGLVLVRAIS